MSKQRFSHVLFDLDNTLFDREGSVRQLGSKIYDEELIDKSAIPRDEAVELFVTYDKDGYAPDKEWFYSQVKDAWGQMVHSPEELAGLYFSMQLEFFKPDRAVLELLRVLNGNDIKWGIVTNGRASQLKKVQLTGLDIGCRCVVVSETFGAEKPDPAIFQEASRLLGSPPTSDTLFVGDNPVADIQGAHDAGMATAWIVRDREWPDDLSPPDYRFRSVLEVRDLLL